MDWFSLLPFAPVSPFVLLALSVPFLLSLCLPPILFLSLFLQTCLHCPSGFKIIEEMTPTYVYQVRKILVGKSFSLFFVLELGLENNRGSKIL